jgi:SAM-dependent methyltransferase
MAPAFPEYPFGAYFACPRCGHGCAPASPEAAAAAQQESFGAAFAARAGALHERYERHNDRRALAALRGTPIRRVLEVGPGSGSLMARLRAAGADVTGLEASPVVGEAIRRRHAIPVVTEELAEYARRHRGAFDCVVLRHVLEHFADPRQALAAVVDVLAAGGTVYVAVPNAASWHRRFPAWAGYQPYHFHYFTPGSLRRLAEGASLEVTGLSTYEPVTGWPNTAYRALRRAARSRAATAARPLLEPVRFAAGILLSPLRWVQSMLGGGEELVLVARKPAR